MSWYFCFAVCGAFNEFFYLFIALNVPILLDHRKCNGWIADDPNIEV